MNRLGRMIRRERRQQYKYYRKLFKARDMASPYVGRTVKVSEIDKYFSKHQVDMMFTITLAKTIVDGRSG